MGIFLGGWHHFACHRNRLDGGGYGTEGGKLRDQDEAGAII